MCCAMLHFPILKSVARHGEEDAFEDGLGIQDNIEWGSTDHHWKNTVARKRKGVSRENGE